MLPSRAGFDGIDVKRTPVLFNVGLYHFYACDARESEVLKPEYG
jgi:hypothetical protein